MARYKERILARNIRRKGKSIKDIAKQLSIAKSTISIWCRDIILTEDQIKKIYETGFKKTIRGGLKGAQSNKQKKIDEMERMFKEADKIIGKLSYRDLLVAGVSLYWAEGAKTGGRFIFVNSDPVMIKIVFIFLTKILKIDKNLIHPTLQINSIHKPRVKKVMKFWAKHLGISPNNFCKPYFINVVPKKVYENYDNYYGILRLRVLKSSSLQYKILGFINVFKNFAGVV